jgi:thioredoxin 1
MNNKKLFIRGKQVVAILMLCVAVFFIVGLFLFKGQMNEYASRAMKAQSTSEIDSEVASYIDSSYNYIANNMKYKATFLEFGATGCSTCKRMESVMEEIKTSYGREINVVFIHAAKHENRKLLKYYGVATIPTQVLLNKEGKEFFRHSGYITPEEIVKEVNRIK